MCYSKFPIQGCRNKPHNNRPVVNVGKLPICLYRPTCLDYMLGAWLDYVRLTSGSHENDSIDDDWCMLESWLIEFAGWRGSKSLGQSAQVGLTCNP